MMTRNQQLKKIGSGYMDLKQVSHRLPNLSLVRELLVLRLTKEALQTRTFLFWTLLSPSLAVSVRSFWRQEACEACFFHILAACSLFSMTGNQPNNEEWDEESLGNDGADYTSDAAVVDSDDNLHTPLISRQTRSLEKDLVPPASHGSLLSTTHDSLMQGNIGEPANSMGIGGG